MRLSTHPNTIRPDHSVGRFSPSPFPLEDDAIAKRMAQVIIRAAKDGEATELHHFRDAPETKALTADEIARHIGKASRIADKTVIRQDAIDDQLPADPSIRSIAERMADTIIRGMMHERSAVDALQRDASFTGRDIATHLDAAKAIVDRRLARVAPANPTLVNLAFALKRMVTAVQNEVA